MTEVCCRFSAQCEFSTPARSLQMSLMKLPPPLDLFMSNPKPELPDGVHITVIGCLRRIIQAFPREVYWKPGAADVSLGLFPCYQTPALGPVLNHDFRAALTNTLVPQGGPGQGLNAWLSTLWSQTQLPPPHLQPWPAPHPKAGEQYTYAAPP